MLALEPTYLILGALLVGLVATALYLVSSENRMTNNRGAPSELERAAFVFSDGQLIDANQGALRLSPDAKNLSDITRVFAGRFAELPAQLKVKGTARLASTLPRDRAYLDVSVGTETTTIVLIDPGESAIDRHIAVQADTDLRMMDEMVRNAPFAIWATSKDRDILFKNDEFSKIEELGINSDELIHSDAETGQVSGRVLVEDPDANIQHWFDVTSQNAPDGTHIHFAIRADAIVQAEAAQRNFVQTLTKTFAQLSIGLAIFDRKRQLALFNPALIDLTTLTADFLSARPSLSSFFDQLRDRQIMPEPRDYKTWRDQLSDMIVKAEDGIYCETWTLPSGLTYRISGKPHPDGAVAFLFEDISAEISLTRRFRAELEMSQSVLDTLDEAIAVFSRTGVLRFTNARFRTMWKCNPDESFIEMTIVDITRTWASACAQTDAWDDLRDFIMTIDKGAPWAAEVTHETDGPMGVTAQRVTGASTLVSFKKIPTEVPQDASEQTPSET